MFSHLDSCQSCGRFQHQLDQVVAAANEMPLPEDAMPTNLESLARMVMQQLPQQKASFLSIFGNLFGGGGGGAKQAEPKLKKEEAASRFPHIRPADKRTGVQKKMDTGEEEIGAGRRSGPQKKVEMDDQAASGRRSGSQKRIDMDDQQATSMRLRGLSRLHTSEQSASNAKSLGEKFGMAAPASSEASAPEGPANLAESIRRKVSEDKVIKEAEIQASSGGWEQAPDDQGAGWGQPPAAAQAAGWGQPPAADQGADWGQPPAQGVNWGQPPAPAQAAGWGQPAPAQPQAGWGTPEPAQQPADGWGQPQTPVPAQPQAGWGQPPTPQPAEQGWGQPPAPQPAEQGWGQPPAPQPAEQGWGQPPTPQPGEQGWGQPPAPQPAEQGWGQPPAPPQGAAGWGQPQAEAQAQGGGWDQGGVWQGDYDEPPVETGFVKDGWDASPQSNNVNQPASTPAWPTQPAGSAGAWSAPSQETAWSNPAQSGAGSGGPASPAGSDSWGARQEPQGGTWDEPGDQGWDSEDEQIQTGMWQVFTPGDQLGAANAPKPASSAWQQPTQPAAGLQPPAPAAPAPAADRWDTPIQARGQQPPAAQPGAESRWDMPIQERAPQAPKPAAPEAERWDIPIQERLKMQAAGQPAPPAGAPSGGQAGLPVDSIMNRLSNILGDTPGQEAAAAPQLQTPPAMPAPPPAPLPAETENRWDVPIQERIKSGQAQPPAAPAPAPTAPAPAEDRWDIPIQERLKGAQNEAPAGAAAQAASEGGIFKNLDDNAMDKLFSQNLGVNESSAPAAKASAAPAPAPPAPPIIPPAAVATPPIATPAAAQPAPAPVPAAAATPEPAQSGLFKNLDDSAMDKLFSDNLGVTEAAKSVSAPSAPAPAGAPAAASAPPPPPVPPIAQQSAGWGQPQPAQQAGFAASPAPPAPPAQSKAAGGGLFSVDDDAMDRIFADNLGVKDSQAPTPKVNVNEAVQSIRSVANTSASAPVKVEGLGRLDKRGDNSADAGSGKIAAIGKFLLDQQDLTKIGNLTSSDLTDTKMRILTLEAAQELQTLLHHIGAQPGVLGSVIVGHDGILIANSMPNNIDPESIGVWALGVYLNTDNVIKKMGHNHIHQVVARTPQGYLIIADFGGGILVTLSEGSETDKLVPLMRSITQLVAQ